MPNTNYFNNKNRFFKNIVCLNIINKKYQKKKRSNFYIITVKFSIILQK